MKLQKKMMLVNMFTGKKMFVCINMLHQNVKAYKVMMKFQL